RLIGFAEFEATVGKLREVFGLPARPTCARDEEFREAYFAARRLMDQMMRRASDELAPHIESIAPELAAAEKSANALPFDQRMQCFGEACRRLYAPFQDKVDGLRRAQTDGLAAYDERMERALSAYRHIGAAPTA